MKLSKLYSDPDFPGSFSGADRFYHEVVKLHPQTTRKQIVRFLKTQKAYTLHKRIRKPRKYRRTLTYGPRDLWQIDLLDLQKFKNENKQYRYLCVIIDCFSKFVWVKPLKNKTAASIVKALSLLLMMERPKHLQADQGSEFFNKQVAKMLQAFGPKLYYSYSEQKASIVERVQRTLRARMGRLFTHRGNNIWIDKIDEIVAAYNNSYHRSIKMKPADVTQQDVAKIRQLLFPPEIKVKSASFKVGDVVRIVAKRKRFQKEYEKGWTVEKFRIKTIVKSVPITYLLEDLSKKAVLGSFYPEELQHVD